MQEILQSKKFKIAVSIIGAFLIILIIFAAGISVGLHKAKFSCKFGENYERNFMGNHSSQNGWANSGPMGMMREKVKDFEGRGFRNAHGIAGTIISITDNNIVIKDKDNKENTVAITDKTIIKLGVDDVKISDLKNDQQVVVMGNPGENGVVNADLIRVFNTNISNQ
jgi:RNase P/RNase MRP subunit p29